MNLVDELVRTGPVDELVRAMRVLAVAAVTAVAVLAVVAVDARVGLPVWPLAHAVTLGVGLAAGVRVARRAGDRGRGSLSTTLARGVLHWAVLLPVVVYGVVAGVVAAGPLFVAGLNYVEAVVFAFYLFTVAVASVVAFLAALSVALVRGPLRERSGNDGVVD